LATKDLDKVGPVACLSLLLLLSLPSSACNVPVFRYALERWPAAPYEVIVFHRGPLAAPEQTAKDLLDHAPETQFANLAVTFVDLSATVEHSMQKLWQHQTNAPLPWVVVRYPDSESDATPFWGGTLNGESIASLIDSPARREISGRLLKGESAVWVLLESGQKSDDDAVAKLLYTELNKMETTLTLPPPAPDDPQLRSTLPVRLAFSVMRISRNDPAEQMLVRILLGGEKEMAALAGPIACPIFGRGRMLAALSKKELGPKLIAQACSFVCGACSCEVKDLSPGRDLLLAANWNSVFDTPSGEKPQRAKLPKPQIAQPPSVSPVPSGAAPLNPIVPVSDSAPSKPQPRIPRGVLYTVTALAAMLVVVTGLIAIRSKQGK
jgi:hypothetical protein